MTQNGGISASVDPKKLLYMRARQTIKGSKKKHPFAYLFEKGTMDATRMREHRRQ
jgi:hypothetical protein